jgi:serine/threonine protein phosphatase PrpC
MGWFTWIARLFAARRVSRTVAPALEVACPPAGALGLDDDVTRIGVPDDVLANAAPPALLDAVWEPERDTAVGARVVLAGAPVHAQPPPDAGQPLRLLAYGDGDTGQRRRKNEDSLLLLDAHDVFAVADGMGAAGQLASSVAVSALRDTFESGDFSEPLEVDPTLPRAARELTAAVARANRLVRDAADEASLAGKTGSTLLVARFSREDGRLYLAHVGDSRCYRLRGTELTCLTTDQTMLLAGLVGPGSGDLLQAIGITQSLAIDLLIEAPEPGDTYLLCSDGLPKMLDKLELQDLLAHRQEVETTVYELIERANDRGGRDNVSVIVLCFPDERATIGPAVELPSSVSGERPSLRWLTDGVERTSSAFRADLNTLDDDATTIAHVPHAKAKRGGRA